MTPKEKRLMEMFSEIEEEIKKEDNKHDSERERLIQIRKNLEKKNIVRSIDKTLYRELIKKKIEPNLKYFKPVDEDNYKDFIE